jgi:hypothetical protein
MREETAVLLYIVHNKLMHQFAPHSFMAWVKAKAVETNKDSYGAELAEPPYNPC